MTTLTKNPLDDDLYDGNDDQIEDLKTAVSELTGILRSPGDQGRLDPIAKGEADALLALLALLNTEDETELTAQQLDDKYNQDGGEHPRFPRDNWRSEVFAENTLRGYWEWVEAQIWEEAND